MDRKFPRMAFSPYISELKSAYRRLCTSFKLFIKIFIAKYTVIYLCQSDTLIYYKLKSLPFSAARMAMYYSAQAISILECPFIAILY